MGWRGVRTNDPEGSEREPGGQLQHAGVAIGVRLTEIGVARRDSAEGLSAEKPVLAPKTCGWLNRLKTSHRKVALIVSVMKTSS